MTEKNGRKFFKVPALITWCLLMIALSLRNFYNIENKKHKDDVCSGLRTRGLKIYTIIVQWGLQIREFVLI